MAFHEVRFPVDISYGSEGGPRYNTGIIELDSGAEERVQRWSDPKYVFNVSYGVKTYEQLRTVSKFFMMRQGATSGFRYKDFTDYSSADDHTPTSANVDDEDQLLGTGDSVVTTFQLQKTYSDGTYQYSRTITKPVAGTVLIALDAAAQTEGTHYTVDTTTGIITFVTAPGSSVVVTAGFEFDVPVRFGAEIDSGGLTTSIDSFDTGSVPDIELVEDRDAQPIANAYYFGGAKDHGAPTTDFSISAGDPRVNVFAPTGAVDLFLPPILNFANGGPHFILRNTTANAVTVRDNGDTVTIDTLSGSTNSATLSVSVDSAGARSWVSVR